MAVMKLHLVFTVERASYVVHRSRSFLCSMKPRLVERNRIPRAMPGVVICIHAMVCLHVWTGWLIYGQNFIWLSLCQELRRRTLSRDNGPDWNLVGTFWQPTHKSGAQETPDMASIGRSTDGLPLTVPIHVRLPLCRLLPAPMEPTTVEASG